jgi:peroxiredoxin
MAKVPPPKTPLKVGDIAPDFQLPSTQGTKVKLSSFLEKKNVVLAFYPAAFTGGCTKEMSVYQANITKLKAPILRCLELALITRRPRQSSRESCRSRHS